MDEQISLPAIPHDRIKLNVGGKLFETTASTLQTGGPDSLLVALSATVPAGESDGHSHPIFIDRDPEIFSVLLSLLRSNRLPSTSRRFSKQELAEEALYYGVESRLRSAMVPPPLAGIDAAPITTILPTSDSLVTALSADSGDGSVWIAHGGQISSYDWILSHVGSVRTHLDEITSLRRVWPEIAAVGSLDSPGLHFYDLSGGRHAGSVHWTDKSDPRVYKARVSAISDCDGASNSVFAAFECHHRENCILAVDRTTLQVVAEIGRQSGSSTKVAAPRKVAQVPAIGALFASTVSVGAFGYSGYMKLWDPRSGEAVWETTEPGSGRSSRFGDSFADAEVDREEAAVYKVCWRSGDVGVADLRRLGEDPWVYLEERSTGLRNAGGGENSVVCCYQKQVFVSRSGGLEVWSPVEEEGGTAARERVFRRNFVDREEQARMGRIKRMEGGGDRLFVCREGVEGVEVWESSELSGAVVL